MKLQYLILLVFGMHQLNGQPPIETTSHLTPNNEPITFVNSTMTLNAGVFVTESVVGITDMNGDCLDDLIRINGNEVLMIEYHRGNGIYETDTIGAVMADSRQWSLTIGDVDENGFNDIIVGGDYDEVKLFLANNDGTEFSQSTLPNSSFFVQGTNLVDINTDGFIDLFVCNDLGYNRIWTNDGMGNFSPADELIDQSAYSETDASGNYGSLWTDFDSDGDLDLYIAKCHIDAESATDLRRINQLYVNDGQNNYTEAAADFGLANGAQSWTSDFQDFDNDGDLDVLIVQHETVSQLLRNDNNITFVDITTSTGLNINTDPYQGLMRDFDNDGFVDILVSGPDGHQYFKSNANGTFVEIPDMFEDIQMATIAVGDLNHDGFFDVYSSRVNGAIDVLWLNSRNTNHYLAVTLKGTQGNLNAIGSRIELYGAWGKQIREVRSGESYGIMNSFTQHFGLGEATSIDSLVVHWTSGNVEVYKNPQIDQFLRITEGDCAYPDCTIDNNGIFTFCTGDTVDLIAPLGLAYQWSNSTSEASILRVTEGGTYQVTVTNAYGCSTVSHPITVIENPDETPTISIVGETTFCSGAGPGVVILTSSEANDYLWSTGSDEPTIYAGSSGDYSVQITGGCGTSFTSDIITVIVVPTPAAPEVMHDTINVIPGIATLAATGDMPHWYDETGDMLLSIGNTYTTPPLTESTTYVVQNEISESGITCASFPIDAFAVVDTTTTSIIELNDALFLEVFPNPAKDRVQLQFNANRAIQADLSIFSNTGQLIQQTPFNLMAGLETYELDLSGYSTGVYWLEMRFENDVHTVKLVVEP